MAKCVIFDFDGVLVLSNKIHLQSEKEIFKKKGLHISFGQLSQYFGMPVEQFIQAVIDQYKLKANTNELVKEKYKTMHELIERKGIEEVPHAFELAKKCKKKGLKIAIASGSKKEFIEFALKKTRRRIKFDAIIGAGETKKGKPQPDIFLKIAKKLKLKPKECIVIEDATNGIIAAKKAGMKCIALKNKESGLQDLSKADRIIKSLSELSAEELAML